MKQEMRPRIRRACRVVRGRLRVRGDSAGIGQLRRQRQQKDKKNKNKKDAPAADNTSPSSMMSDEQQIDYQISTMLGAWQVNDLEKLHQTYAEDVVIVSGNWAPPIVGWANFSAMYQQQRAQMQQVRMDRSNTAIKVFGNLRLGLLSVGFFGGDQRTAVGGAGTNHASFREAKRKMADRAQPHIAGAGQRRAYAGEAGGEHSPSGPAATRLVPSLMQRGAAFAVGTPAARSSSDLPRATCRR